MEVKKEVKKEVNPSPTAAMRRPEFRDRLSQSGELVAAACRAISKVTGLPALRILEEIYIEAEVCLLRWRRIPPAQEPQTWGPQELYAEMHEPAPPTTENKGATRTAHDEKS